MFSSDQFDIGLKYKKLFVFHVFCSTTPKMVPVTPITIYGVNLFRFRRII